MDTIHLRRRATRFTVLVAMQRNALVIMIAVAVLGAACSGSHDSTSPRPASVQFDSLKIVNSGGTNWVACCVTNVGPYTAYEVMVYWHSNNDGIAQVSPTQPSNLHAGESAVALTMRADNVAWTWPSGTDSIRWSESH